MANRKEQGGFLKRKSYSPPTWAAHLALIPSHIYSLGHFPTPIHKWNLPGLPEDIDLYIKRDDLSGVQLSGNKVRKLEFLMEDAVSHGADCIITIGGVQSNHCRATAVASKYFNLDCYLILCTSKEKSDSDPGLSGNLLLERLVGAHVQIASVEEFEKFGSLALLNLLKERLVKEGRRPYAIPVGGSNSLGIWGYIEAVQEIEQQLERREFDEVYIDDIVAACGSAGTIVGLSLGSWLSTLKAKVHAFSVGDNPDNYYEFAQGLLDEVQVDLKSRDLINIQDAKGLGYSISTTEELAFIKEVAEATGVILDPVYSGKAAYALMKDIMKNTATWVGRKILFIHTGGIFGMYDKSKQLTSMVGKWNRLEIDESVPSKDTSQFW